MFYSVYVLSSCLVYIVHLLFDSQYTHFYRILWCAWLLYRHIYIVIQPYIHHICIIFVCNALPIGWFFVVYLFHSALFFLLFFSTFPSSSSCVSFSFLLSMVHTAQAQYRAYTVQYFFHYCYYHYYFFLLCVFWCSVFFTDILFYIYSFLLFLPYILALCVLCCSDCRFRFHNTV